MPSIISPLRYPGSKRRLAKYIDATIGLNNKPPKLFVELFAGGASVSIHLLSQNSVDQVGLVEKDPLVAAFWKVVFSCDGATSDDLDWLLDETESTEITVEKWRTIRNDNPTTLREKAFKCLFLNRTSFSGIIAKSAGPIGGQSQRSKYPIDCRFPKQTIISRIEHAASFSDRVAFVYECDWLSAFQEISRRFAALVHCQEILFYLDPPFYMKADRLYNHFFTHSDHVQLRDTIRSEFRVPYILSYDKCEEIEVLYRDFTATSLDSIYVGQQSGGKREISELIYTNVQTLPAMTRIWQSAAER